ncbi:MAG: AraC family transcriptional regulator [Spirochaetales bacterium]|nr:AraC family transcriptional regulator [Spirochaetales bacterium]
MDLSSFYIEKINNVIDYIDINFSRELNLQQLSEIACISKYHFHRIFNAFTGEPLYKFITRIRLEKAAAMLLTTEKSITAIAFECGFNDSATFSRGFKNFFSTSARAWQKNKNSKNHQELFSKNHHICNMKKELECSVRSISVAQRFIPASTLIYKRHSGKYEKDSRLFNQLFNDVVEWTSNNIPTAIQESRSIVVYHDPKGITDEDKLRISVGLATAAKVSACGEIGTMKLEGGDYLVCGYRLRNDEYGQAWTQVFREIMPQRGLLPENGFCYEEYPHDCYDVQTKTTLVNICIPVSKI